MLLLIWTGVLLGVLYLYLRQIYSRFTKYGVKQRDPVPLLGNMLPILRRECHFIYLIEDLHKRFPEERFLGRYEFLNPVVEIRDLELIKKITIKDFEHFLDHRGFTDAEVEPLFARNLFTLKGEEWKDMRSTLSPAFTSSKIRVMVPFMEEVGNQMVRVLKKRIEAAESKAIEVDYKDLTTRYTNDVIASCAFGLKVDSHTDVDNKFYEMGRIASSFKFRQMLMFLVYSACPILVKWLKLTLFTKAVTKFFTRLVLDTMYNREANNIIRPDMIHLLMEAKKGRLTHDTNAKENIKAGFATVEESALGQNNNKRAWADNDLIAQAVLFFIAGFETISVSMSFALYELAINPEVQEKLAKEIMETDAMAEGKLDYNAIQKMSYMDMVVSEVVRLWPPVASLDRICTKDYNLGKPNKEATKDYIIRKGEVIAIPVWAIHHDPQYFPEPEKFDPDRFSDHNKDLIKPMTYMPFGVGPRNCIGSRFALCELKMLIYHILLHFELSPSERTSIPAKISSESINMWMEGGHWLNFSIRHSSSS
ncbi:cytochrome P450 9e2-like [Zerene cesonia]|uniref:cytochrome P450 9e2-like n=1 Tax=Zerene cesonia TaxID=33412 RepID=UPI0018E5266D|nr:cytochrome P450 9e2-like [Zerene cesonia]